jgi:hypothetical protein
LNRPFLNSSSVSAAERAVDFRPTSQLVVWGVGSPNDDRIASLWGRAARDVRMYPALDVSNIDFAATSRAGLCTAAAEAGVHIKLLVGDANAQPLACR